MSRQNFTMDEVLELIDVDDDDGLDDIFCEGSDDEFYLDDDDER